MENSVSKSVRDMYVQYRTNPDNEDKNDSHFCTLHGVSPDELREIKKSDSSLHKDILSARRNHYAQKMTKIDEALFKAAEGGDTKAADLLYRRFDGWNPKIVEETNNYYNFADMVKGIHKKATIIKRPL